MTNRPAPKHRASPRGALCCFGALLWLLPGSLLGCGSAQHNSTYAVAWVYDGDTLRLEDGRRIRLIGIDTPELGRDGKPAEPYAQQALQRLRRLVEEGGERVRLRLGPDRRDHYGRYLAHVYLPDQGDVAEQLLQEGLGRATIMPPNIRHLECLLEAERRARDAGRGLWHRAQVADARTLAKSAQGFRLVRGLIQRVGDSRCCLWRNLEGGLALRIDRKDLNYFPGLQERELLGRELEVRGWIYLRNGEQRMQVRHGAAIRWLGKG